MQIIELKDDDGNITTDIVIGSVAPFVHTVALACHLVICFGSSNKRRPALSPGTLASGLWFLP